MTKSEDNMKVVTMTMPSEDAAQLALEQYDTEPDGKNPKKLLSRTKVDLAAVNPSDLPKHYKNKDLVDLNLGELLSLSVLGQYYHHTQNSQWDVVLSVEDAWKNQTEQIISDGALKEHDKSSRMIFQQVLAQDIAGKQEGTIEEIVIQRIQEKESRRSDYPKKCGIILTILTQNKGHNFKRIMDACHMAAFDIYFCIEYRLPDLDQCIVYYLDKDATPEQFIRAKMPIVLQRYENPHGDADIAMSKK